MVGKISYAIGYALGAAFIYGLYALGIWGVYSDVSSGKLPLLPLTYLFSLLMWRRFSYISRAFYSLTETLNNLDKKQEQRAAEARNVINKLNKFGGPN